MRRPSIYLERRTTVDMNMTPMIDVVFQLLIFFVWTTGFQVPEQILPSRLSAVSGTAAQDPSEAPPPERDFDDVVVRILWDGAVPSWRVNHVPLASLNEVGDRLQTVSSISPDVPVILHPDPAVPMADVVDVYDLARRAGFQQLKFAIREKLAPAPSPPPSSRQP